MICPTCHQHVPPRCPTCGKTGHWLKGRRAADGTQYRVYRCNTEHRFVAVDGRTATSYREL